MTGTILRSIDGAFQLSDNYKSLVEYGLDLNYINSFFKTINQISSVELRDLAQEYMAINSLFELTVGGKNKKFYFRTFSIMNNETPRQSIRVLMDYLMYSIHKGSLDMVRNNIY